MTSRYIYLGGWGASTSPCARWGKCGGRASLDTHTWQGTRGDDPLPPSVCWYQLHSKSHLDRRGGCEIKNAFVITRERARPPGPPISLTPLPPSHPKTRQTARPPSSNKPSALATSKHSTTPSSSVVPTSKKHGSPSRTDNATCSNGHGTASKPSPRLNAAPFKTSPSPSPAAPQVTPSRPWPSLGATRLGVDTPSLPPCS